MISDYPGPDTSYIYDGATIVVKYSDVNVARSVPLYYFAAMTPRLDEDARARSMFAAWRRWLALVCDWRDGLRQQRHARRPAMLTRTADPQWLVHRERWNRTERRPRMKPEATCRGS